MLGTAANRLGGGLQRTAAQTIGGVRYLNVHEYVTYGIMKTYGIQTPECYVASTPDEAQHLFSNSLNKRESVVLLGAEYVCEYFARPLK